MQKNDMLTLKILPAVIEVLEDDSITVTGDSQLIGDAAVLSSRQLVELLLLAEEIMDDEFDVEFDWTGDAAMSQSRSIFRTPASLSEHLSSLIGA